MAKVTATLDILSQDYPDKSIDQNQARLINMYLEPGQVQSRGKYKLVAYPMPGLTQFCDTAEANIRAMLEYNGVLYVVTGNKFGSINSGGTFTQLGSNLSTSSGFAKITSITGGSDVNNQVMIIDGTFGYTYNIDTSTATFPISDVDFPDTAVDITSQDDYVLVANASSIQYNLSNLADTTTWAALDFASKISMPDNLVGIHSHKKKVWLFGNRTTEVVYDSGNASFPFETYGDIFLNIGLAAVDAKVMCNDQLYFLGQSKNGGYAIYKITDFLPQVISTPAIDTAINNMTTVSDCRAYSYKRDGHEFIDWVFPTENITKTYDETSGAWISRQSLISASYQRFLGNCSAFCYNKSLIGSFNSGKIYTQTNSVYTEAGTGILRQFVSPPLYKDGRRIFIPRLQIDVETNVGSSKTFTLETSNDAGRTWDTIDTYTIPADNTTQLYTTSLGSAYNWMFRISTTMNANFILLGAIADIIIGDN